MTAEHLLIIIEREKGLHRFNFLVITMLCIIFGTMIYNGQQKYHSLEKQIEKRDQVNSWNQRVIQAQYTAIDTSGIQLKRTKQ